MEYKKLSIPFKERLVFLFTGLIPKKYIENRNPSFSFDHQPKEDETNINNIEENTSKIDIPFFDLDKSKTKSNL